MQLFTSRRVRCGLPVLLAPLALGFGVHIFTAFSRPVSSITNHGVDFKLREHERTAISGSSAFRYDFAQLASNSPIEDYHAHNQSGNLHFYGIYDGHGGDSTSQFLQQELVKRCINEINANSSSDTNSNVASALKNAFVNLDDEILDSVTELLETPNNSTLQKAQPALSGSCAIMSVYNDETRDLTVAVTGDSRAVYAEQSEDGIWRMQVLTEDQTATNANEKSRVVKEHPNEPKAIFRDRLLGIYQPTRCFGDGIAKWSVPIQRQLTKVFNYRYPSNLLTPPYMTAEPVVTSINVGKPGFLVIGSDGLFDELSNTDVVQLVVSWINHQIEHTKRSQNKWGHNPIEAVLNFLPHKPAAEAPNSVHGKLATPCFHPIPFIPGALELPNSSEMCHEGLKFSLQDMNCATHLLRNALGYGDEEKLRWLLNLKPPKSRNFRDDITIQVVFFS